MKDYYNLMEGHKPPKCVEDEHDWEEMIKPTGHQSGWHEDRCVHCGIVIGYDTSD